MGSVWEFWLWGWITINWFKQFCFPYDYRFTTLSLFGFQHSHFPSTYARSLHGPVIMIQYQYQYKILISDDQFPPLLFPSIKFKTPLKTLLQDHCEHTEIMKYAHNRRKIMLENHTDFSISSIEQLFHMVRWG